MATSQNGWPASPDPSDIDIVEFRVPDTRRSLRACAKAAPLLLAAASEWHKNIERIDSGQLDDWGYCYRPIRGTTNTLSNHSSGTAIDINSSKHPLGAHNTFTPDQRRTLATIAKRYGLRSGEFYSTRPDGMHLEVDITPAQAAVLIKKLNLAPDGTTHAPVPAFHGPYEKGDKGAGVKWLQSRLKYHRVYGMVPTGLFGHGTQEAVKKFQHQQGIKVTGVVNQPTWNKLGK